MWCIALPHWLAAEILGQSPAVCLLSHLCISECPLFQQGTRHTGGGSPLVRSLQHQRSIARK